MSQPRVLFPIAVDPGALTDHPTDRDQLIHREVVTTLGAHGILTLPEADQGALLDAIAGLGEASRKLWEAQIHALYDLNRLDQLPGAMGVGEILRRKEEEGDSQTGARVFVASRALAEEFGVDDTSGSKTVDDSDVVLASTIHRSPAVVAAKEAGLFPTGKTRRPAVANTFIHPLAERSSAVKILDPHILEGLISGNSTTSHAEWLIQRLADSMPANATLSILGKLQRDWQTADRPRHEARIEDFLSKALQRRTLPIAVEVRLLKSTALRDRFIWFSSGSSFDVLHNFTALSSEVLNDDLRFIRHDDRLALQTLQTAEAMENNTQPTMVSITKLIA
ncbi:MAG TPA: hypothetical protein DEA69_12685 [Microbacterium sp.]|uniref:hypothetical protein n=1 Tax=unclassified Microbacterium TaxID=2609290 RepID=UPI000C6430CA|nr:MULTISPECIES: hypothetical protein [unclassified Microbacterium]MBU21321.1 hypothetical protein [Microbacterium sp.]RCL90903.1 MAG: hypothetical protein DBW62_03200 [Microbacterium sp.]HBS09636.1 hypothetical protein [Microbacterium sp.]|tara:strand:+ start:1974 stop:2981 length:1008 start_codon:yes stop_codon:yes gene_type:complete